MKNLAAATLALLTFAAGASAQETQRYLVGTKHPFRAGALAAVLRDARGGFTPRSVAGFDVFDGFAADLTSSEAAALARNPSVRWVEPVLERHAFALVARNPQAQTVPYGVDLIHTREAWSATHVATTNVVVIDTGVDYRHPELKAVYAGGYNFVANNSDPLDDGAHGTHVAGTIAAANNDIGVVGIAPDVRLWALKVLGSDGSGSSESVVKALDWIIAKKSASGGNWVANLSLGASRPSTAEREAFARAINAGLLIVAASGNESTATIAAPISYPAAYDGVVAVGAVDDKLSIASFSNQGPQLDVVAPGVDVLSTLPVGSGSIAWIAAGTTTYGGVALTGAKRGTVTGEYVFCGLGKTADIPASVAGKIALIKRGDIRFNEKARNAKQAGAIAVAIFNFDTSPMNWTLTPDDDPSAKSYDWPVTVGITQTDGEALVAHNAGTITVVNESDDYGVYSGTSMASPHVAGAAAFLWSASPSASASDVAAALTQTASDLGVPGIDNVYGSGIINVFAAVVRLAPSSIFPPPTPPTTGRRILKRGH
jgi:subtilisin family serine protease